MGDYLLQNDWMATNKAKLTKVGYLSCFTHCIFYTLPFFIYGLSPYAIAFIFGSHFLIDKYGLSKYWVKLWNWNWLSASGYSENKPAFLTVWLAIIVDNTFHLMCNYFAISFL